MKQIKGLFLIAFLILALKAQAQDKGIQFETTGTWADIIAKAKAENKFIFVDFMATWCVPCKEMDKDVYSNDTVGRFANAHFISVKIQFDSTKTDDPVTKARYADARSLAVQYKVSVFPTFLFFSPEGKLVHRSFGLQDVTSFAKLLEAAQNPRKQYYTLLESYNNGTFDFSTLLDFDNAAMSLNEKGVSNDMAKKYFSEYLSRLPDDQAFTRDNLLFLGAHLNLVSMDDKIGKLIYQHMAKADSLTFPNYAEQVVSFLIKKEQIYDKLYADSTKNKGFEKNPNWDAIHESIAQKYGKHYADTLIISARFDFYRASGDFDGYAKLVNQLLKQYPPTSTSTKLSFVLGSGIMRESTFFWSDKSALNRLAMDLFQNTFNKYALTQAIMWINLDIELKGGPNNKDVYNELDTKAGLLYKLGKKKEAIALERHALDLIRKYYPHPDMGVSSFKKGEEANLSRMERGEKPGS